MRDTMHFYVNPKGIELCSIDIQGTLYCFDTKLKNYPDDKIVFEEMGSLQYDGYELDSPVYDILDVLRHAPIVARKINIDKLRDVLPLEGEGEAEFDFLGFKATGWIAKSDPCDFPVIHIGAKAEVSTIMSIIQANLHDVDAAAQWTMNSFEISKEDINRPIKADVLLFVAVDKYIDSEPEYKGAPRGKRATILEIDLALH